MCDKEKPIQCWKKNGTKHYWKQCNIKGKIVYTENAMINEIIILIAWSGPFVTYERNLKFSISKTVLLRIPYCILNFNVYLLICVNPQTVEFAEIHKMQKNNTCQKEKWVGPVSVQIYIIFLTRSGHCFFHMWITDKKRKEKSFQNSTCNFLGHVKDIFTSYYYVTFKNIHEKDFESRRGLGGSIKYFSKDFL